MIDLTGALLIGKGLHRECYRHPQNPALCIKVVYNGNQDESRREQGYYRLLEKRRIDWRLLPRFHGTVDTNRGTGAVFDLIQDFDGNTARSLEFYLENEQRTEKHQSILAQALTDLRRYLLEHCIVTMTLKPKNIVFRRLSNKSGELVIVDNIGNSDFIPISSYVPALARRKTQRKWTRFETYLVDLFPCNSSLRDILNEGLDAVSLAAV